MPTSAPDPDPSSAVRPARSIAFLLVFLTLVAIAAVMASGLPTALQLALVPILAAHGLYSARQFLRPPIRRLAWDHEELVLRDDAGVHTCYRIGPGSFVSPVFIGLVLVSDAGARQRVGLFREQVCGEFWRQTMIRARARAAD